VVCQEKKILTEVPTLSMNTHLSSLGTVGHSSDVTGNLQKKTKGQSKKTGVQHKTATTSGSSQNQP